MKGYQISEGLAKAMGRAFELYGDIIEKLYMESNGTNDDMLANILAGLCNQKNFKTFAYKKSKLGDKSLKVLTELVNREMPHNLDELRIVSCQVPF